MQSDCAAAAAVAVNRAQAAWRAFYNGDFVRAPDAAEAQFRRAKEELARADRDAAKCSNDMTEPARARLHSEIDVVEARRKAAKSGTPALPAPPIGSASPSMRARCAQPDASPYPLSPIVPGLPDPALLRRPHGATAITVLVGPEGSVLTTLVTTSSGNATLDRTVESAARLVAYAPAKVKCKPVEGSYRFTYTFPQI